MHYAPRITLVPYDDKNFIQMSRIKIPLNCQQQILHFTWPCLLQFGLILLFVFQRLCTLKFALGQGVICINYLTAVL